MPISVNVNHIKELYLLGRTKLVKIAYVLNDECLNPQRIEKTHVSLATRVFSEFTRNALKYYVDSDFPVGNYFKLFKSNFKMVEEIKR